MSVVTDPKSGVTASVKACNSCHAPIYWGYTAKGKRCPYDVIDGEPTEVSHFTTCPQANQWSKRA